MKLPTLNTECGTAKALLLVWEDEDIKGSVAGSDPQGTAGGSKQWCLPQQQVEFPVASLAPVPNLIWM